MRNVPGASLTTPPGRHAAMARLMRTESSPPLGASGCAVHVGQLAEGMPPFVSIPARLHVVDRSADSDPAEKAAASAPGDTPASLLATTFPEAVASRPGGAESLDVGAVASGIPRSRPPPGGVHCAAARARPTIHAARARPQGR